MKDPYHNKKPALWLTAGLAAASLVPAVLLLKKARKSPADLEGRAYEVESIVYQAPFYRFSYQPETAPLFRLQEGMELSFSPRGPGGEEKLPSWQKLGSMEDLDLEKENFDRLFFTGRDLIYHLLRRKNARAWKLDLKDDPQGTFYYLLQQKNGRVYLALGYRTDGLQSQDSKASIIRWLFLLAPVNTQ